MIEKLRKEITLIVLFAITIPLLFILTLYAITYTNNIIKTNARLVDRFFGEPNGNLNNKNDKMIDVSLMDGIYSISISNGNIIETSSNVDDEIREYALKISNNNNESGIVGK